MSRWFRWLIRLSPMRGIITLGVLLLVASLSAYVATDVLMKWRSVIWYHDVGVRWPQAERDAVAIMPVIKAVAWIAQVCVLVLLPVAAGFSAIASWTTSRVHGTDRDRVNLIIATNTLLFLHRRVSGAFKAASAFLSKEALAAQAKPVAMAQSDIKGYRVGDVIDLFDTAKDKLRNVETDVHEFIREVTRFRDVEEHGRQPAIEIVAAAVGAIAERPVGDLWIASEADRPSVTIRLHAQGPAAKEALLDVSAYYAREVVEEAVVNAVKSVRKRKDESNVDPLPSGAEIDITMHVTNELVWVYVLDTGVGLQGKEPLDLAVATGVEDRVGFNFGLYSIFALERLNICSYFLTDAAPGGALARICFRRAESPDAR
jgi:hypothetical protein